MSYQTGAAITGPRIADPWFVDLRRQQRHLPCLWRLRDPPAWARGPDRGADFVREWTVYLPEGDWCVLAAESDGAAVKVRVWYYSRGGKVAVLIPGAGGWLLRLVETWRLTTPGAGVHPPQELPGWALRGRAVLQLAA